MYIWDAEAYRKSSTAQWEWGRELIERLRLRGDESVLDIGCGDGKLTVEIARLAPRGYVVGLDSSPEMIYFARRNFPSERYPNLVWVLMDAEQMNFNGVFDLVFSNSALHWIKDQLSVLKKIKRSLKPSGRVMLRLAGKGNALEVVEVLLDLFRNGKWVEYFHGFQSPYAFCGPEEYEAWLREAGLRPLRVELTPKQMTQPGSEGLAAWIRTTWLPLTQRIPGELREDFIRDLVEGYLERYPPDAEGLVRVSAPRLDVEAINPD